MENKGLITFLFIILFFLLVMIASVYAYENIEFEKFCFDISGNYSSGRLDLRVSNCFMDYVALETADYGTVYVRKEVMNDYSQENSQEKNS